jgi:hypothetical protein
MTKKKSNAKMKSEIPYQNEIVEDSKNAPEVSLKQQLHNLYNLEASHH